MNSKQIRWQQRFNNYSKSFKALERAVEIINPNEAEKGGIIQFYEVTFELFVKITKRNFETSLSK